MYRTTMEAVSLEEMSKVFNKQDPLLWNHCRRTALIAHLMLPELDLSDRAARGTLEAAALHDIGFLTLSEELRLRWPIPPGKLLSEEEWEDIEEHPRRGYRIVSQDMYLNYALSGILYHHERWDGSGYPEGREKTKIPVQARIIAVADTLDSMVNPGGIAVVTSIDEAVKKIQRRSGIEFDPKVVKALTLINTEDLVRVLRLQPDEAEEDLIQSLTMESCEW